LGAVTRWWRRSAHDDPFCDLVRSGCRLKLRRLSEVRDPVNLPVPGATLVQ
jgi:hypothetical protein